MNVNTSSDFYTDLNLIENSLRPFIENATVPNESNPRSSAKNLKQLVIHLINSAEAFMNVATDVFKDHVETQPKIINELDRLSLAIAQTVTTSKEFTREPCSIEKRVKLIGNARYLLSSIARIMAIADMISNKTNSFHDIKLSLERELTNMQLANNNESLNESFQSYTQSFNDLMKFTSQQIEVNSVFKQFQIFIILFFTVFTC
jgi:hypothetical protein